MKKTEKSNTNEIIEIPAEEAPYALPDDWKWVRGLDIFEPMKSKKPSGEYFYYIDIDSIDNKRQMVSSPKKLRVSEAPSRANRELHCGDTVFSLVRPYLKNIAYIDESLASAIASTGFFVCTPNKNLLNPKYNYYLMISNYVVDGLNSFMKGDNSPSIRNNDIEKFCFPLPPLETQKRIVDRIESLFAKLDEAKEKAQTALDTFELRKSAILHKAFTGELTAQWREENRNVAVTSEHSDNLTSVPAEGSNGVTSYSEDSNNVTPSSVEYPNNLISVPSSPSMNEADSDSVEGSLPNSWRRINLQNVCATKITDDTHKTPTYCDASENQLQTWRFAKLSEISTVISGFAFKSQDFSENNEIPCIKITNVGVGEYIDDKSNCLPESYIKKYPSFIAEKNNILVSLTRSYINAGLKVCLYPLERVSLVNQRVALIKNCNEKFVFYFLSTDVVLKYVKEKSKTTNQPNLSIKDLCNIIIPLPPLPEQKQIVRILDDLLAKENAAKEAAEAVIEKIDLMKKSILARAFRGEL